jgi:hypothetical protein
VSPLAYRRENSHLRSLGQQHNPPQVRDKNRRKPDKLRILRQPKSDAFHLIAIFSRLRVFN